MTAIEIDKITFKKSNYMLKKKKERLEDILKDSLIKYQKYTHAKLPVQ